MPNYRYKGRGRRGDLIEGAIEAASRDAVAAQRLNSDISPIDITENILRIDPLAELKRRLTEQQPGLDDLILFARQRHTLLRAGVPISQALTGLVRASRNAVLATRISEIKTFLEGSRELSAALARHPELFSNLFLNTVRIGENTGRLDTAFERLAAYLDRDRDTRA